MKLSLILAVALVIPGSSATAAVPVVTAVPQQSAFSAMEGEMVPVLRGIQSARDAIPVAVQELSRASGGLRTADVPAAAEGVEEAFAELGVMTAAGLAILDEYPTEACSADYTAVLRTGLLLMSDAAADIPGGAQSFNTGMHLVLVYGDGIRGEVAC